VAFYIRVSPMTNKNTVRQTLRNKRIQLSQNEQQKKSQRIVDHILQSTIFSDAQKIGYYYAVHREADPANLNIKKNYKKFYLPVISNKPQALEFAPVIATTQYQNNQFSIPEPICKPGELISTNKLDLLILPLLGFNKNGNRLGMGGGFYDRCLSYKQQNPEAKPILIGFAYNFQEVKALQAEPWDIGLDWIATESGLESTITSIK